MTTTATGAADMERVGQILQEFFRTVPYSEWEHQTVALNRDTMSVVHEASSAEIARKYGENFVVVCFGAVDTALRPRRLR